MGPTRSPLWKTFGFGGPQVMPSPTTPMMPHPVQSWQSAMAARSALAPQVAPSMPGIAKQSMVRPRIGRALY